MTIPITSCCCNEGAPPGGSCGDMCDCQSAYTITTWNLVMFGVKNELVPANRCNNSCDDYDGPNVHQSTALAITGYNLFPVTLQRYPSNFDCCYQAMGTVRLSVDWDYGAESYCCDQNGPNPPGGCLYTTSKSVVRDVPYCLTAVCDNNPATGQAGMHWTLLICSFSIGEDDVLLSTSSNCVDYADCENLPLDRRWIIVGPARYSWWTPFKCPDQLNPLTDYPYSSLCWNSLIACGPQIPGQDPIGYGTSCAYEQEFIASSIGPFAIYYSTALSEPQPCAIIGTGQCSGFWYPCLCNASGKDKLPGACEGQVDWSSDCCEVTLNTAVTYPVIIYP